MSQKFIIVYPGQGSQKVGMGKDFFKSHKVAKEVFEEVDESLRQCLSKIIFEGPKETLTLTSNTQPALMAVSIAISRVLEYETKKNIYDLSEVIIGHSLGEYTALCSLGAINLNQTAKLLRIRGSSMQNSVKDIKTKMIAVIGMEIDKVEKILEENELNDGEVCEIANDNCPGQVILSGTEEGVDFMGDLLKKSGAKSLMNLKVSAPFHCSLMKDASIKMNESLSLVEFKNLEAKFISNVTANFENDLNKIKELLVKQVSERVRWRESILKATQENKIIIEIGSGKVLTGLNKRINKNLKIDNISDSNDIDSFLKNFRDFI